MTQREITMTQRDIADWLCDFLKRSGHNNAPGCLVCMTISMLIGELIAMSAPSGQRIIEGVIVTGPEA